jgi:hypothetical protein
VGGVLGLFLGLGKLCTQLTAGVQDPQTVDLCENLLHFFLASARGVGPLQGKLCPFFLV